MLWRNLCSLDVPTYPSLVRELYNYLARGSSGFTCRVRETSPTFHSDREATLKLILERDEVNPSEVFSAS